jgi:hypothetical protein
VEIAGTQAGRSKPGTQIRAALIFSAGDCFCIEKRSGSISKHLSETKNRLATETALGRANQSESSDSRVGPGQTMLLRDTAFACVYGRAAV